MIQKKPPKTSRVPTLKIKLTLVKTLNEDVRKAERSCTQSLPEHGKEKRIKILKTSGVEPRVEQLGDHEEWSRGFRGCGGGRPLGNGQVFIKKNKE